MTRPYTRESPEVRFWSKVEKTDGCWIWKGCNRGDGYGAFSIRGRGILPHRFGYELSKGEIPKGLQIDHLCRNRLCVNPEHLEAVSQKENILRGDSAITRNRLKTHCPRGHPLIAGNLDNYEAKKGYRYCLICRRMHSAKWKKDNWKKK